MLLLLVMNLFAQEGLLDSPAMLIDDSIHTKNGTFLIAPQDALVWNNQLFIADISEHTVFVYDLGSKTLSSVGRKGQAPGEFDNSPQHLFIKDGKLHVEEWNRYRGTIFSFDGSPPVVYTPEKEVNLLGDWRIQSIPESKIASNRYTHTNLATDCFFGRLSDPADRDLHLSASILVPAGNKLVLVRKAGVIAVYDELCQEQTSFELPLETWKQELEEDQLASALAGQLGSRQKRFKYGLPIKSAASDGQTLFLLIQHEQTGEQQVWWVSLESGKVRNQTSVVSVDRLVFSEGYLLLLSAKESMVKGFYLKKT